MMVFEVLLQLVADWCLQSDAVPGSPMQSPAAAIPYSKFDIILDHSSRLYFILFYVISYCSLTTTHPPVPCGTGYSAHVICDL